MKLGILGYGRLARGVEIQAREKEEFEIRAVFTRRKPSEVKTLFAPVYHEREAESFRDRLDCLLICRGSATDLPTDTPRFSKIFDTVDSYDTHSDIEKHKERVDRAVRGRNGLSIISVGWDPGLLSLARLYFTAFTGGVVNSFWGEGVSQGHTQAISSIEGVKYAVQYTVPREDALIRAANGESLSDSERHKRVCYVVAKENTPSVRAMIERKIVGMENYFAPYETEVIFLDEEQLLSEHSSFYHRGRVICSASTGLNKENSIRCSLDVQIGSNPELTASVMLASARALYRMKKEGRVGAYTLFDLPPKYLMPQDVSPVDLL